MTKEAIAVAVRPRAHLVLHKIRLHRGVSLEDLAARSGLPLLLLQRLEEGSSSPSYAELEAVSVALAANLESLVLLFGVVAP